MSAPARSGLRRLAVLGHPVAHSRSPAMHNAALAAVGLDDSWAYEAIEVAPDGFGQRVRTMAAEGFVGANVTVPHKPAALALADGSSLRAREIGAANTLVFGGGVITAENTDAAGFVSSLPSSPAGARALVLGAGGAARAVVWALLREGAEVEVWNRTGSRATELCDALGGSPSLAPDPASFELIVNSTSIGLGGEDPFAHLPLQEDAMAPGQTVVDIVYTGQGPGPLLEAAARAGANTVDGIEILVRQGAASFELWTGLEPPLDVMRAAARSG